MRLYPRSFEGQSPREFGTDENIIKTRRFYLDNARSLQEVALGGSMLWAYAASDLTANVAIRLNDQLRDAIIFQQGMYIRGTRFSRLYMTHAAQAGAWIEFVVAVEGRETIEIVNPAVAFTSVSFTKASVLDTAADVTLVAGATTAILAAAVTRRVAFITNLATNAKTMRIGDLNAGATRGIPLAPGETITVEATEAIYGFNPAAPAGNENVAVMWSAD